MRQQSKQKISVLKRKLWEQFAKWIKNRDVNVCFTCGRKAEGSGIHCGHFIPKSVGGIALYFHEDNCHAQCYNCNINLSGNQYHYGELLGKEKVEELRRLKQLTTKWSEEDYNVKIEYYKTKNAENEQTS